MSAFKYNYALVSRIPDSYRTKSRRIKDGYEVNIDKARGQHEQFVDTLRHLGINVLILPADEKYPDCAFIDDTAVVINGTALICKPATPNDQSRLGEVAMVRNTLKKEVGLKVLEIDKEAASLFGGDVLWTGKEIFVGLSSRTNEAGAQAVAKAFPEYPTCTLRLPKGKHHLKSLMGMAGNEVICCSMGEGAKDILKQIGEQATFRYQLVTVDPKEYWAAGVNYINGTLLHQTHDEIPLTYSVFEGKFDQRAETPVSELLKAFGTISSLALLIGKVKHPKNFPTTLE